MSESSVKGWRELYAARRASAAKAIAAIRQGDSVVVHSACGEPRTLLDALVADCARFDRLVLISTIIGGRCAYLAPELADHFRLHAFLGGGPTRAAMAAGQADYLPCHVSLITEWLRDGKVRCDVALLQVSPPGEDGQCCLGISADHMLEALAQARVVIAEVNEGVPRVPGAAFVPVSEIDHFVAATQPPIEIPTPQIGAVEEAIGRHVAALVPDGATVQVGVGAIAEAVTRALAGKRDLGVHSGLIPDAVIELVEAGVINGRRKSIDRGKIVTAGLVGTARLYRWAHENPAVEMKPTSYTHDPKVLRQIDNFISINAAVEVDLLGRVNSETVAGVQLGGVGGQLDFIRGAAAARGGRSIIVLSATTAKGKVSRIVPRLAWSEGAVLTTMAEDVHYIVTEYGAAELRGKTARQRAAALIALAHPASRPGLEEAVAAGALG